MTNQLSFNEKPLAPIIQNNQTWLTSRDLAKALGYKDASSVTRIYNRNQDEFSVCMTTTVNLTVTHNEEKQTRIFSLRGCHLIAMFARTEEAKAFRKWVLDLLDKEMTTAPQPFLIDQDEQHRKNYQLLNNMIAHMQLPNSPVIVPYVEIANLVNGTRHIQQVALNLQRACGQIEHAIDGLKQASGKSFGDFD